jgi:hypothetical protein
MPNLSMTIRNAILDSLFNAGSALGVFDGGTAEFRSGAAPGADNTATGTVIASVALGADSMTAAASGSVAKNATWQDLSADNAGTIGHARFKSSDGLKIMEFTVTATGGGGEITVDNTVLTAGQQFTVTGFTVTMPAT